MLKRGNRRGQSTMEYVLVAAVILAALIAAVGTTEGGLGQAITTLFSRLGEALSSAVNKVPKTL